MIFSELDLQVFLKEIKNLREENAFLDSKIHSEAFRIQNNINRLLEIKNLVQNSSKKIGKLKLLK